MGYEMHGTIILIGDTQQVSERFSKRAFVVETFDNPKYPQTIEFQATGDRCALLDEFSVGDKVYVEFSIRGREWRSPKGETRYFNSLDAWKIEATEKARKAGGSSTDRTSAPPASGDVDDIPFATCDISHEPSPIARVLR